MGANHDSEEPRGIVLRAVLPTAGSPLDEEQRLRLAQEVVVALRDAGWICDLIIPQEWNDSAQ
jgi:hypothetical protein